MIRCPSWTGKITPTFLGQAQESQDAFVEWDCLPRGCAGFGNLQFSMGIIVPPGPFHWG